MDASHQLEEFSRFPECLSIDGTCNTNSANYILMLLCGWSSRGVYIAICAFLRSENQHGVRFVHRALMDFCKTAPCAAAQSAVRNVRILMSDAGLGKRNAHEACQNEYGSGSDVGRADVGLCTYVGVRHATIIVSGACNNSAVASSCALCGTGGTSFISTSNAQSVPLEEKTPALGA